MPGVAGWVGRQNKLILISNQVEVLVGVGVELYVAVVKNWADLHFPDKLWTLLSQLLDVAVVEAGAELCNTLIWLYKNWSYPSILISTD